jgi:membrane protein required for beta-lactamase induction
MKQEERRISFGGLIVAIIVLVNVIVLSQAITTGAHWYGWLLLTVPLLVVALAEEQGNNNSRGNIFPGRKKRI